MSFITRTLQRSLNGEISAPLYPYATPEPDRFFFSDEDVKAVESVDDTWELVELGLELWNDVNSSFQECEPLEQLLEATSEETVIVAFGQPIGQPPYLIPTELYNIDFRRHTVSDIRFTDVRDHRAWMEVAYQIVGQYVLGLSQRVEASRNLHERMVLERGSHVVEQGRELVRATSAHSAPPLGSATSPQAAAFAGVRGYFVSTPEEIIRIISSNEGTIKLKKVLLYEAAMILEPLKNHYGLKKTKLFNVRIHVEGMDEFHWFDKKRTLHNNLKASKDSYGSSRSSQGLSDSVDQFKQDLARYLPRSTRSGDSPTAPQ